jgi:coenzyme F420-reducing hydrogenase delta subunit
MMQRFLQYNGIEPGRFQARWISGSEAGKFKETIEKVTADVAALGPNTKFKEGN